MGSVNVSDEDLKVVQSGIALRFTVSMYADDAKRIGQWQKGWMAFRTEEGGIDVKPPVTPLNLRGKRIKYYAAGMTPEAVESIKSYIEETWGSKLTTNPDWNSERAEKRKAQSRDGWAL